MPRKRKVYDNDSTEVMVFDRRTPEGNKAFRRERRARDPEVIESLGYGRFVLVIRAGSGEELAW